MVEFTNTVAVSIPQIEPDEARSADQYSGNEQEPKGLPVRQLGETKDLGHG